MNTYLMAIVAYLTIGALFATIFQVKAQRPYTAVQMFACGMLLWPLVLGMALSRYRP